MVGGGGGKCIYSCYIFALDSVVSKSKYAPVVISKPAIKLLLDYYLMLFPLCVCVYRGEGGACVLFCQSVGKFYR